MVSSWHPNKIYFEWFSLYGQRWNLMLKRKKDRMILFSSNLYKSENCTLTVYKSKPKVKVLLLSTKHTGVQIEDNYKRVPETLLFTIKQSMVLTKWHANIVWKQRGFRWPLQVFFNILDLAVINAWILYKECTRSKISRKEFIFCLAEELAGENKENICQRSDTSFLSASTSEVWKGYQVGYCKKK